MSLISVILLHPLMPTCLNPLGFIARAKVHALKFAAIREAQRELLANEKFAVACLTLQVEITLFAHRLHFS